MQTMTIDQLKTEDMCDVVKNLDLLDMSGAEIAKYLMDNLHPEMLGKLKFQYEKYSAKDLLELACIAISNGNEEYFRKHLNAYIEQSLGARISEEVMGAMFDRCTSELPCKRLMIILMDFYGNDLFVNASNKLQIKILMCNKGVKKTCDILDFARYLVFNHGFSVYVFETANEALKKCGDVDSYQRALLSLLHVTGKALAEVQMNTVPWEKY